MESLPLWVGEVKLTVVNRGEETALSLNAEEFEPYGLVEVLKHFKNQRMADAIIYGLIGQLEAFKMELLGLWMEWQEERVNEREAG